VTCLPVHLPQEGRQVILARGETGNRIQDKKRFICLHNSGHKQSMKRKLPMPDTTTDQAYDIKNGHAMA
jgi:hypothetical protein